MDGLVLVFTGPLGSHKSALAERVATALGVPRARFGDYIRAVARERQISESAESLQMLGQTLISEMGYRGICEAVLRQVSWQPGQPCVVDGVRHKRIVEELRAIVAPLQLKLIFLSLDDDVKIRRLEERGIRSVAALQRVERHPTEIEVPELREIADLILAEDLKSEDILVREVTLWMTRFRAPEIGTTPEAAVIATQSSQEEQAESSPPTRSTLTKLHLANFKSFADEAVALAPLTVLVGANASGKSNFLDAIRFLWGTRHDQSFPDILDGDEQSVGDAWRGIRGGVLEAARVGGAPVFTVESTWRVSLDENWDPAPQGIHVVDGKMEVTHSISCRTHPYPRLESESLAVGGKGRLFTTGEVQRGQTSVPWPPYGGDPDTLFTALSADRTVLWTILGSLGPGSPQIPEDVAYCASALSDALGQITFLDIQPSKMRGYGRVYRHGRTTMGSDGRNLSGALASICGDPNARASLVHWLRELCAPELLDIDFAGDTNLGDVMAMLVENGNRRVSVRSLSDGTLRFLGLLIALRTAAPGSIICIEDIETGMHPSRIQVLVEYLDAAVRERNIQVIASTHSPVVLQWLPRDTLDDAVLFGRVPEHEGTLMRRLGDLPHFRDVLQKTGIDALFTTGWLERAL